MTVVVRKGSGLRPVVESGMVRRPPIVQTGGEPVVAHPTPSRNLVPGTIPKPRGRAGSGRR